MGFLSLLEYRIRSRIINGGYGVSGSTLLCERSSVGSNPINHPNAPLAQQVEHLIEDQGVGGSIPPGST